MLLVVIVPPLLLVIIVPLLQLIVVMLLLLFVIVMPLLLLVIITPPSPHLVGTRHPGVASAATAAAVARKRQPWLLQAMWSGACGCVGGGEDRTGVAVV